MQNDIKLCVSSTSFFSLVFQFSNSVLSNIFIDDTSSKIKLHSVYLAKITDKNPSLNTYFVDLDGSNKALLKINKSNANFFIGQKILVQIIKIPSYPNKNAVVSDLISYEGALLTYKPMTKQVIFAKSLQQKDKDSILESLDLDNAGIIVRSTYKQNLLNDLIKEFNDFEELHKDFLKHSKVGLLYQVNSLERAILSNHKSIPSEIVVDNNRDIQAVRNILKKYPFFNIKLTVHNGKSSLFDTYYLGTALDEIIKDKINFDDKLDIIFYQTDAFNYIDVNFSGNSSAFASKEEVAYMSNMDIMPFIINQIIVRKISGQILVDLLKLTKKMYKNNIAKKAQDVFNVDNIKTSVLGFSNLGILEISRQKISDNINLLLQGSYYKLYLMCVQLNNALSVNALVKLSVDISDDLFEIIENTLKLDIEEINSKLVSPVSFNVINNKGSYFKINKF